MTSDLQNRDAEGAYSPTRVIIDARKLGDGGIGIYLENLILGIAEHSTEVLGPVEQTLLISPAALRRKSSAIQEDVARFLDRVKSDVSIVNDDTRPYSFEEMFVFAKRRANELRANHLFQSPHYTLPYFVPVPSVVTIHDTIHVTHPERFLQRPVASFMISSAVRRAKHVICVSNAARSRVQRLMRHISTPLSVIPNALRLGIGIDRGSSSEAARFASMPNNSFFFLFVGSDRPHKGFFELIEAWKLLKATLEDQARAVPALVLIGSRYSEESRRLVQNAGIAEHVHFAGDVPLSELNVLYETAFGVVVPSREEGFGFAALEGLASGVPVICSPARSLQEICGNAAWYAEGGSAASFAKAVLACIVNPEINAEKVTLGLERARAYSRKAMAHETLRVYAKVLGRQLRTSVSNALESNDGFAAVGGLP